MRGLVLAGGDDFSGKMDCCLEDDERYGLKLFF